MASSSLSSSTRQWSAASSIEEKFAVSLRCRLFVKIETSRNEGDGTRGRDSRTSPSIDSILIPLVTKRFRKDCGWEESYIQVGLVDAKQTVVRQVKMRACCDMMFGPGADSCRMRQLFWTTSTNGEIGVPGAVTGLALRAICLVAHQRTPL